MTDNDDSSHAQKFEKIRLTYLDIKGLAEPIRLALYIGGIDFEDERISYSEIAKRRSSGLLPGGQVPVIRLEDGSVHSQSGAILRWAGRVTGIDTDPEPGQHCGLVLDNIHEDLSEIIMHLRPQWYGHSIGRSPSTGELLVPLNSEQKISVTDALNSDILPTMFQRLESRLGDKPFLCGKTLTTADLKYYVIASGIIDGTFCRGINNSVLSRYPKLISLNQRIACHAKVQEWNSLFNIRPRDRIVCIGDVHGHVDKLEKLINRLETKLGESSFHQCTLVFLGDLCDRGPDTKRTIEYIIDLRDRRAEGKTRIICGNHDFAFASFIGEDATPWSSTKFDLDTTIPIDSSTGNRKWISGYYTHAVHGGMHYQGRRWGGSDTYNSSTTFKSYGVNFEPQSNQLHNNLRLAVPDSHKKFLKDMEWVVDLEVPWTQEKRVVCVHAGLEDIVGLSSEEQINALKSRNVAALSIQKGELGRFEAFSGRHNVELTPSDLKDNTLVISGHHGFRHMEKGRIICDKSGGRADGKLEACLLPDGIFLDHEGNTEIFSFK